MDRYDIVYNLTNYLPTLICVCFLPGINAILYYAPSIFNALGLTYVPLDMSYALVSWVDGNVFSYSGTTISLLATGVVGIVMWAATIPTVYVLRINFFLNWC